MENLTPMLKQYNEIKKAHPGYILFFRLGDFYEMFYDDAKTASRILDLVLTARSAGSAGKAPMCGIPFHSADSYISKLIKAGCRVAICEQVEDPSKAKGIVKREVVRLITSGTFIDENNHDSRYIISLYPDRKNTGISFVDHSEGGTVYANEFTDMGKVAEIVSRMPVYECIFPVEKKEIVGELFSQPFLKGRKIALSECEDWMFNRDIAKKNLCDHFKTRNLAGFGVEEKEQAVRSAGGLLEYLRQVNRKPPGHVTKLSLYTDADYLHIAPSAVHGLEIDSLVSVLDSTVTPMGKRMLKRWIYYPLLDAAEIKKRQDAVMILIEQPGLRGGALEILRGITDVEKALSRMSCGYGSGVKEILAVNNLLVKIPELNHTVQGQAGKNPLFGIGDIPELRKFLSRTVNQDIPAAGSEGSFVKTGYSRELDELKDMRDNVKEWLKSLQREEIKRTGINSLKIGYTSVFGYYIEITRANLSLVPPEYIRKQTLVNAERFITPQLKEFEEKILSAESRILAMENEIIEIVKSEILKNASAIYSITSSIAVLDVLCSLSSAAQQNDYTRPDIDERFDIAIRNGRHPVVEKMTDEFFVPNDTLMDDSENHFLVITGPNMAGKSTYIRQVALIVIMAQTGSFVPAEAARIGIVDKIFTRIGAHDEISKGQSTFMVEMTETAGIINNLSRRSLVVLDEIGRGTSTYDGFSLAWAVAEHLVREKVRTLFATHFHELTGLENNNKGVKNYNVAVNESGKDVVFLHKIMPGGTDESYGIYVAQIAGIPSAIIKRADEILSRLELQGTLQEHIIDRMRTDTPSLFSGTEESPYKDLKEDIDALRRLKEDVLAIDVDSIAPVEVSAKLRKIQEELKNGKG